MSSRGARLFLALTVLAAAVVMNYFYDQTVTLRTLRAQLTAAKLEVAGLKLDLDEATTAPASPLVVSPPCPVITLAERACPARVVPTLAEVERAFGLGSLDCRTLPRTTP